MDLWDERELHLGTWPAATLPVALLPLRLEAHFDAGVSPPLLKVRAYPDDLHLDSHEAELTDSEQTWGRHYWEARWAAGADAEGEKAAWIQLAERFGPDRAAWVRRVLAPENPKALGSAEPPRFPTVASREDAWTRAAQGRLLPQRLAVLGYRGGRRVLCAFGGPIDDPLPVGPDPGSSPPAVGDDSLPTDPGLAWMVDYAQAESVGMAVTAPITATDLAEGFDTLLVLGMRAGNDGAEALADLLAAQHYTEGLAFVPQGTPSNNAPDTPSGYASRDRGQETSFRVEAGAALVQPGDGSNGTVAATAMGLKPAVFEHLAHAERREQLDARHMQGVLWQVTWGYFLEQMLGEDVPDKEVASTRRHYLEHVRARGPLPALRVGRQPYGLLPVLPLDTLAPEPGSDHNRIAILRRARETWRDAATQVPRLVRGSDAAQLTEQLLQVLALGAVSSAYSARPELPAAAFGDPAISGFEPQLPESLQQRVGTTRTALGGLGGGASNALADLLPADHAFPLDIPLIQDAPLSEEEPLAPNYIQWLRTQSYQLIETEDLSALPGAEGGVRSLLYRLLRHAVLLEYARCAHRILVAEGKATLQEGRDRMLVDITEAKTPTLVRALDYDLAPHGVLRDCIHTLGAEQHPEAARLDELRDHLSHLEALPSARLRWLLGEALDLASHRLDAWITAEATRALTELRSRRAEGIYLGGYGVLADLRPAQLPTRVQTPPPGETEEPLYEPGPDNAGFLHAPSLPQASAGAVLRSGYLAHAPSAADDSLAPLALNLSSARVRLARWLLDGVRQGQPLGALLGYRFERGLTERGLAQYLEAFRVLAPLGDWYRLESEKRKRIDDLIKPIQEEIDRLQGEIDRLQPQLTAKINSRFSLQSRVNYLNGRIRSLPDEIDDLRDQRAAVQRQIDALPIGHPGPVDGEPEPEGPLLDLQAELIDIDRQINSKQATLSSYTSERNSKQSQINTLTTQINTMTAERNGYQATKTIEEGKKAAVPGDVAAAMKTQFDDAIQHYREQYLYPEVADIKAMEAIEAYRVSDGMVLLEMWRRDEIPFGVRDLPPEEGPDRTAVVEVLAVLQETVDAVSDAVTAESLYQTLQGNPTRAGATLDAVASGEMHPPELELVRTPRSGIAVTHRVLVLMAGDPVSDPRWPTHPRQARRAAEPWLDAWAARLLGDPSRVRLRGELFDPESGAVQESVESDLGRLGLSPLDLVYGIQGDGGGEVEERVRYHLRRAAGAAAGAELRLLPEREPTWPPEALSFDELVELARAAAQVIADGASLEPRDVALPGEPADVTLDLAGLDARADTAASALAVAAQRLDTQLGAGEGADLETLREALLDLSHLGLPAAVPRSAQGTGAADRETVLTQGAEASGEAARRLARLSELEAAFEAHNAGEEARRRHQVQRIQAVLGRAFTVLVGLTPGSGLAAAFAASADLQDGDNLASAGWLQRMARVRSRSAQLVDSLSYAEAVRACAGLTLSVAQLPYAAGERWVALPGPVASGRVSLAAHCPEGPPTAGVIMAGLQVDEWVEVIPAAEETTGFAFHYDAPGTEPPHAVLLAVPPDDSRPWDLGDLAAAVLDTLELARLRAVDPDALAAVGGDTLLPAIYLARNLQGDAVSTDFTAGLAK